MNIIILFDLLKEINELILDMIKESKIQNKKLSETFVRLWKSEEIPEDLNTGLISDD